MERIIAFDVGKSTIGVVVADITKNNRDAMKIVLMHQITAETYDEMKNNILQYMHDELFPNFVKTVDTPLRFLYERLFHTYKSNKK